MMFMEGQSIGTFGQVCVNETSYDNKDKICGPNGEIVLVTTSTENCPSDIGTPYCVQCGSVEQGATLCLETLDVPEECSLTSDTGDDAFGNNMGMMGGNDDTFEMLPPSTPSSGISITFSTMISSMMDDSITFSSFDQCDNSADIAAWSLNNISNGDSSMQYCTTQWNGGCYFLGDCTQDCFVELGFSDGCSACFGEVAICFAENCQSSWYVRLLSPQDQYFQACITSSHTHHSFFPQIVSLMKNRRLVRHVEFLVWKRWTNAVAYPQC